MSNRITIIPTKFVDVRNGEETYGYRIYDCYDKIYNNTLDSIPDDDLDLIAEVAQDSDASAFFNFLSEEEQGIFVSDSYYGWEEIKDIL